MNEYHQRTELFPITVLTKERLSHSEVLEQTKDLQTTEIAKNEIVKEHIASRITTTGKNLTLRITMNSFRSRLD